MKQSWLAVALFSLLVSCAGTRSSTVASGTKTRRTVANAQCGTGHCFANDPSNSGWVNQCGAFASQDVCNVEKMFCHWQANPSFGHCFANDPSNSGWVNQCAAFASEDVCNVEKMFCHWSEQCGDAGPSGNDGGGTFTPPDGGDCGAQTGRCFANDPSNSGWVSQCSNFASQDVCNVEKMFCHWQVNPSFGHCYANDPSNSGWVSQCSNFASQDVCNVEKMFCHWGCR